MTKLISTLLTHRKTVIIVFVAVCVICALLSPLTEVNYKLADYLPQDSPSTIALRELNAEFDSAMPNLRIMLPSISIPNALDAKAALLAEPSVTNVLWLDDTVNIREPLEFADPASVESWYKDGNALFMVTCDTSNYREVDIYARLKAILPGNSKFAGDIPERIAAMESVSREVSRVMLIVVPLILVILLLTTDSWFSPILFGVVILSSILMNLGTNLMFGRVSFLTQSIAPVLQLAVSMDYSIFLLNRFDKNKQSGMESIDAMADAVKATGSTILASGATTFVGFLVLGFMRFKIGPDLGFTLAKGIIFSMLSALVLLPCVTLACRPAMLKLHHRPLMPSFEKFGKATAKTRFPLLIIIALMVIPAYLAQNSNSFIYGSGEVGQGSVYGDEESAVVAEFGVMNQLVLMVPKGDYGREIALNDDLRRIDGVTGVVSFVGTVGNSIPAEFVPADNLATFESPHYRRYIISVNTPQEGGDAFRLVDDIRSTASAHYPDDPSSPERAASSVAFLRAHLVGAAASSYDMKTTVEADNFVINWLCVAAIFVILLLTFRSISLPVILMLTIESAIWINLAVPYFQGQPMHFIAYMIVNTVQLGSTIDYAILFTEHYQEHRKTYRRRESAWRTVADTTLSILVPVIILICAGIALFMVSSNMIVSAFGVVLARGAALSAILTLFFLPGLLVIFNTIVRKTTLKRKGEPDAVSTAKSKKGTDNEAN